MKRLLRFLEIASPLYLAIPWLIFALGWLRPVIGLPVAAATLLGLGAWVRQISGSATEPVSDPRGPIDLKRLAAMLLLVLIWVSLSGVGGAGFQNQVGAEKHNAVLKDLVERPWPVTYGDDEATATLVCSVAHYLPAAAVGKRLGWTAANVTLWLTTLIGAALALLWFSQLLGRLSTRATVLFIAVGGLDLVGAFLAEGQVPSGMAHVERWAQHWQYSSNTTLMFWVPQHALCGWIGAALVMRAALGRRSSHSLVFLLGLCALWSPFVAIGLAPLVLAALFATRARAAFSLGNLVAAPFLLATAALFYLSRESAITVEWIWNAVDLPLLWPWLALFLLLEVGLYMLFCTELWSGGDRAERAIASTVAAFLLLLPMFRIGIFNDLVMHASIPALFILWAFVARQLLSHPWRTETRILAVLLILGSFTAVSSIVRSIGRYTFGPPDKAVVWNVTQLPGTIAQQHLGRPDSFFSRWIAPPPAPLE